MFGVVVLCRDYDNDKNPFSLEMRQFWIDDFLKKEKIANICVAQRIEKGESRAIEYMRYFNDKDLSKTVVLTTNETDNMHKAEGFQTCNHHALEFIVNIWSNHPFPSQIKLEGTGRIIRQRLRNGQVCENYLLPWIEQMAQKIIK